MVFATPREQVHATRADREFDAGQALPDPTAPIQGRGQVPVHRLFAEQAARTPDAVAITDTDAVSLTYAQLAAASHRLARRLTACGLAHGEVVAVWSDRSAALPWALLGTLEAGGAFAILDPSYPGDRLAAAVAVAHPKALIQIETAGPLPRALERALDEVGCRARLVLPSAPGPGEPCALESDRPPAVMVREHDLAYVTFTSGTTGRPKGIAAEHAPLSHFLSWHVRTFGFGSGDRFAMLSGLSHDPLLRDIFTPLVSGGTLVVPPKGTMGDPAALRAVLAEEKVTALHLTPSLSQLLAHARDRDVAYRTLPSLKWAFFGGEVLKRAQAAQLRSLAPNVTCVNFYGATETPQAMGYWIVGRDEENPNLPGAVPIGRGIADVQLLVLDDRRRLAEAGSAGEIYVRTPYLARGYLGDEALTDDRFIPNPFTEDPSDRLYRTGDFGRYRSDGAVEILGRADRQVKVRGFRVELDDIESTLWSHPLVRNASVNTVETADRTELRVVAHVAGERQLTATMLLDYLRQRLPEYMVPSAMAIVDALPLTANGKIDRRALPPIDAPEGTGDTAAETSPLRDDIEIRLARIWGEVLHRTQIDREDSFFDLGGDSLTGLDLLLKVEEAFGKQLPVNSLILASSVAKMAELLREGAGQPRNSLLVPIRDRGSRPPVYWLPGGGGLSVMAFRGISHRLGAGQPVYGLEADLDVGRAPTTLPAIVRAYLNEIRAHQPHGPYYLLGFSLGSFVAYELAVQLRAQGEEIGLLVVFDTEVPSVVSRLDRARLTLQRARYRLDAMRRDEAGLVRNLAVWSRAKLKDWKQQRALPTGNKSEPTVFDVIVQRNINAVWDYASRPLPRYDGKVTCVLARSTSMHGVDPAVDPRLAWRHFAAEIETHYVDGNHLSMLELPDVEVLAATLRHCIRRAQADARTTETLQPQRPMLSNAS